MKISDLLKLNGNDYTSFEQRYKKLGYGDLVKEPFSSFSFSLRGNPPKMSVIIPCFNVESTIIQNLQSIEFSTFNLKYSDSLEVIAIDDGSTDNTWAKLKEAGYSLDLDLKVYRQLNAGRSSALNTALSQASGDIIVSCDSDILLHPHCLEEFAKRHQINPEAVYVGFRSNIQKSGVENNSNDLIPWICNLTPAFWEDNRFTFDFSEMWPDNMFAETNGFKQLGNSKGIWVTSPERLMNQSWTAERMVYGFLFSTTRKLYEKIGGYYEGFQGWGYDDTFIGMMAMALGYKIIPVPSSIGFHVDHDDRSLTKWGEFKRNFMLYEQLKCEPLNTYSNFISSANRIKEKSFFPRKAQDRIKRHEYILEKTAIAINSFKECPSNRKLYYSKLGDHNKVVENYFEIDNITQAEIKNYINSLIYLGEISKAKQFIKKYENLALFLPGKIILLGIEGEYIKAKEAFLKTKNQAILDKKKEHAFNPINYDAKQFFDRGLFFLNQKSYYLAFLDLLFGFCVTENVKNDFVDLERCRIAITKNFGKNSF